MRTRFKSAFSISLILLLAVSLAACSSSSNKAGSSSSPSTATAAPDATPAPKAAAPKEVKEISLVMFKDWYNGGFKAIDADINARSAELGFKLKIEQIVGGGDGNALLKARFSAKQMPMLLAIYGAKFDISDLGGVKNFQDLTGDWTKNFPAGIINSPNFTSDGKVYGVPFDSINVMGIYYNKKVFAQLNIEVPQTYQQFLDACAKIKAAGIQPIYAPYKDGWTINAFENDAFLRSGMSNAELFDKVNTNKLKFADMPYLKDTFVKHKELVDKGYIQKTYLSDTYPGSFKAIAEGTAAMTINASWIVGEIAKAYPDKLNDIGGFRIPFDEDKKVDIFTPFAMQATTAFTDKDLLKKFMDYFTDTKTQQMFFDAQPGIPAMMGIDAKLAPAQADMKKIAIDAGNGEGFWADSSTYDTGNWSADLIDYFQGKKTVDQIVKNMDDTVKKDAITKNSPDFK